LVTLALANFSEAGVAVGLGLKHGPLSVLFDLVAALFESAGDHDLGLPPVP